MSICSISVEKDWHFGLSLGPIFGDKAYHEYYYEVESRLRHPGPAGLFTQGGYGGIQCALLLEKKFKKIWIGNVCPGGKLAGSRLFQESFGENNFSFMGGLYFSWIFKESKTLVEADK